MMTIDQQSASLDDDERLIKKNAETINGRLGQIATLKAILIDREAHEIAGPDAWPTELDRRVAMRQLAQEYPGIFQEEKE
jgi:hypothetical protein